MSDVPGKPPRKTLQQTAIILNVSIRTVRRYLKMGLLEWSDKCVKDDSIDEFLSSGKR